MTGTVLPNEADAVLRSIFKDFNRGADFFSDIADEDVADSGLEEDIAEFEAAGLMESDTEKALYLTFHLTLNFNRNSDRLNNQMRSFRREEPWIFEPATVIESERYQDLRDLFKGKGKYEGHPTTEAHGTTRWGKTDADYWYTVASTLHDEYNNDPLVLFDRFDDDAGQISEHIKTARSDNPAHDEITTTKRFPGLGGEKVAPLWLRAIHDIVRPLENTVALPFPVDVHTARVVGELLDEEFSADDEADRDRIREHLREFCSAYEVPAVRVDRPLWLLGKNWEDGGEDYLQEKQNEYS